MLTEITPPSPAPTLPPSTLYERLGGTPGITAIVDDIVLAHLENPTIRARFEPYLADPERVALIKRHTVQFLAMGTGGPAGYEGKDMRDAHRGMNISAEEFVAAVDDIMLVLRRHDIDEATRRDVLAISYSLKSEIVRV